MQLQLELFPITFQPSTICVVDYSTEAWRHLRGSLTSSDSPNLSYSLFVTCTSWNWIAFVKAATLFQRLWFSSNQITKNWLLSSVQMEITKQFVFATLVNSQQSSELTSLWFGRSHHVSIIKAFFSSKLHTNNAKLQQQKNVHQMQSEWSVFTYQCIHWESESLWII